MLIFPIYEVSVFSANHHNYEDWKVPKTTDTIIETKALLQCFSYYIFVCCFESSFCHNMYVCMEV